MTFRRAVLAAVAALVALPSATPARGATASAVREAIALVEGWTFQKGPAVRAEATEFDDSSWETVALPHTWNAQDSREGSGYYRGDGWYRVRFRVSPGWVSRQIYLQFDGANRSAEVFLNGSRLGEHRGGFARFRFDATPLINFDGDNVLAVRVNNGEEDMIAPLHGEFIEYGGLYRSVSLFTTDRIQIETLDRASPGVFVRSLKVTPAVAELDVRVKLANREAGARDAVVKVVMLDATGAEQAVVQKTQALAAKSRSELTQRVSLLRPHLWDGRRDPYLYRVRVELSVEGVLRDVVEVPWGVRSFAVDPDRGFLLNGRPLELRGVNRQQHREGLGWAIGEAEDREDLALMLEMGCNAGRTVHGQQSPLWYDLADRAGMILWTEIPLVYEVVDTPEFFENCREQLRELIRQNYNHPSVVFWGIGNETFVRDKALMPADTNDRLLRELAAVVREEDGARLSAYASNGDVDEKRATISDVIGFSRSFGWNYETPEDVVAWLDRQRAARPDLRIGMSAFGAGANPDHHEETARQPVVAETWHPEEWQAHVHEVHWQALAQRPWVWGKFVGCMFDPAGEVRGEDGASIRNDTGLVTSDRKTRKDAFHWYKANWSSAPVLHITSKRFGIRSKPVTTVRVYSNAETVELKVNETALGKRTAANHIFLWTDVALSKGDNRIEARAERDGRALIDTCIWKYAPPAGK